MRNCTSDTLRIFKNTIFVILSYSFAQYFYHVEFVRETVEDFSFDKTNSWILSKQQEQLNSPNLLLFEFDDFYMKSKNLVDKKNNPTYGYLFPRRYIAEFILKLDHHSNSLVKNNKPKVLFIDYSMQFTSSNHNDGLSKDDIKLIEILKKDRDYIILLPKLSDYNFIENIDDQIIQKKIKQKQIIFVSVGLTNSKDDVSRRYYPWAEFKNQNQKITLYPNVNIAIWQLINTNSLDMSQIKKQFTQQNIIENRIIFKDYEKEFDHLNAKNAKIGKIKTSYWKNYKTFSANYPLDNIINEDFGKSIIYLGGTFSSNDDIFQTNNEVLSGIEVHANALMTLFYLDGNLQRVDPFKSTILVTIIFFILSIILVLIYKYLSLKNNWLEEKLNDDKKDLIEATLIMVILLLLSAYYFMNTMHLWFSWAIPTGSFIIFAVTFKFILKRKIMKILSSKLIYFLLTFLIKIGVGKSIKSILNYKETIQKEIKELKEN